MNREEADDAFDCLSRHARAAAAPGDAAQALALVDAAGLAQLQRDAIIHYISVGPGVVNLAYRVLKTGTAMFVAARFAAEAAGADPRARFAERMAALEQTLAGSDPAARATGLIDALAARLAGGRELLSGPTGAASGEGVGDLLEAAGIAYVLAQLLENPPQRAPATS